MMGWPICKLYVKTIITALFITLLGWTDSYNFNLNGGLTTSIPTKNGYTFAGWWPRHTSVQSAGYTIYYNYTLYAKWTANLYDITYNANGGSAVSSNVGVNAFPSPASYNY